ncbi:hypothetical protein D918_08123 [Trichuris suis]|nr:hypothetical protein D918_08123 [Trichuris suis]
MRAPMLERRAKVEKSQSDPGEGRKKLWADENSGSHPFAGSAEQSSLANGRAWRWRQQCDGRWNFRPRDESSLDDDDDDAGVLNNQWRNNFAGQLACARNKLQFRFGFSSIGTDRGSRRDIAVWSHQLVLNRQPAAPL